MYRRVGRVLVEKPAKSGSARAARIKLGQKQYNNLERYRSLFAKGLIGFVGVTAAASFDEEAAQSPQEIRGQFIGSKSYVPEQPHLLRKATWIISFRQLAARFPSVVGINRREAYPVPVLEELSFGEVSRRLGVSRGVIGRATRNG